MGTQDSVARTERSEFAPGPKDAAVTGNALVTAISPTAITGNAEGTTITGTALLTMLNRAIDESGRSVASVARAMGVKPPRMSALRNGDRPWTLDRVGLLPAAIQISFLRQWAEATGVSASVANALRTMAEALDPQGHLPLIGAVTKFRDK